VALPFFVFLGIYGLYKLLLMLDLAEPVTSFLTGIHILFWAETFCLWAFGTSWLVKGQVFDIAKD
jgi:hypothetical protein